MGTIVNWANENPGYSGSIPKSAAFLSEILRQNGYATASIGKWHLIPDSETTLAGPYEAPFAFGGTLEKLELRSSPPSAP